MPKKIFELAKELEMGPLDLVEDLKGKGYNVRNHMTSLSDDDVEKILSDIKRQAEESVAGKKKVTKRKTVKKKAAKKKASSKIVTVKSKTEATTKKLKASGPEEDKKPAASAKKKVTKKRTVIRRKSGEKEQDSLEEESLTLSQSLNNVSDEVEQTALESAGTGGLRVISRPEAKAAESAEATSETQKSEDKVFKEKVHKFTPVFIPEKKKEEKTEKSTKPAGTEQSGSSTESSESRESGAKKRIGGLASMISTKKNSFSRSQVITQSRADSEMKSYSAVAGTGRPLYTSIKKKRIFSGATRSTEITDIKDSKRIVKLHNGALATILAKKLKVKLKELVDKCLEMNLLVKGDDFIGVSLATEIAALYEYRVEDVAFSEDDVFGDEELNIDKKSNFPVRNPIITIMGHVDHGKTSLLDYIRKEKVADGEAGGITQHIGAYSVETSSGKTLTFLDTPGHAAFASMRQRGADLTDIVILVVAADDGVMPQTRESIKFIKQAGVPLIVAINKMDKDGANPDRVKQELTEFNISPEEWGGDTMMVPISALKGDGVSDLLDTIALQAEIMELHADDKGQGKGIVIESKIESGRGPVATVLVQAGTLKKGDSIVVGESYGRARSLTNHLGVQLPKVGPSMPVQILGLNEAPSPGDQFNVVKNEREAKKIVQKRMDDKRKLAAAPSKNKISLEDFFAAATAGGVEQKDLNLIIRSDVQGSFEAIKQALEPLSSKEVQVKVIGGGVGPISDSDVQLADSADGIIIGFNMRPATSARKLADQLGIDVKTYSIIYELINDVTLAAEGMLTPDYVEKFIGRAEVRDTFSVPKIGLIAGSIVIDGSIKAGCNIRLLRNGKIMFDGKMSSLKRFKDDAKEVKNGTECGIGLEGFTDVRVEDIFEAYMLEEKKRTLEDVQLAEEKAEKEAQEAKEEAAAAAALEAEAAAAASASEQTI